MTTRFPDDDPLAARLRDALNAEAAIVEPSDDGLSNIREGVAATTGRPWWRHPATPAAAAAVVLALMAGGIAVAFHGTGGNDDVVTGGPQTSATSAPASAPATSAPSSEPEVSDPAMTGAPVPAEGVMYVYYTHVDGQASRLYREQVPAPGKDRVQAALTAMFDRPPADPDYRSPWRGNDLLDYRVSGDTATVDLASETVTDHDLGVAEQQLVYTVTANDPAVTKVRILVHGKPGSSGSKPVSRAPMVDVQGWIWLLSPTEGQTVSSPVTISGYGTAFEGTISWEVTRGGVKVAAGHTQGGSNGEFGDFSDTVTLDPGTYQVRAFEASAETGRPVHVDTKSFTVR